MKFGYTLVYVPNVEAAVSFYEAAFSLSRKFVHESGQYGEMDTGETALGFVAHEMLRTNGLEATPITREQAPPAIEIAFVTKNVAEAFAHAVKNGATKVSEPKQKPWGQTVAYVRDLNGLLVELCSPMG